MSLNLPELPEVETTIRDLRKKILKRIFIDVWSDWQKIIKKPKSFGEFEKKLKGKRIERIWRRGKNIIFDLSGGLSLLLHQKLTGHLLYGKWEMGKGEWQSREKGPLKDDPINRFLHLIFFLDSGEQLALSDVRKFAKVELWGTKYLEDSEILKSLGPEPLEESFTFEKFKERLKTQKGKIKQTLMDQTFVAGIGNIYSDEILFKAGIHPLKEVEKLNDLEIQKIYKAMKEILKEAIERKGTSVSDYRTISGEEGSYGDVRKVYRLEGEKCSRCGTKIKRIKLRGRSAHFCPKCQTF